MLKLFVRALVLTVLLFVLLSSAAPIPEEGVRAKRALKQLKLKRGDALKRDTASQPKPSQYYRRATKRDEASSPSPSKGYNRRR